MGPDEEQTNGRNEGSVPAIVKLTTPSRDRGWVEWAKDWLQMAQSVLTIAAIAGAGWWFLMQRQAQPHLRIEHRVTHRRLAPRRQLLIVDVMLSNVGNTKLDLQCGKIRVFEILPSRALLVNTKDECNVGERVIEPGEGDQVHEEYEVDGEVSTVRIYSFFQNPKQSKLGWDLTSFYDLDTPDSRTPTTYSNTAPK